MPRASNWVTKVLLEIPALSPAVIRVSFVTSAPSSREAGSSRTEALPEAEGTSRSRCRGSICFPSHGTSARSITLRSWRRFPGHGYDSSSSIARWDMNGAGTASRAAASARKARASSGTSPILCRSGGSESRIPSSRNNRSERKRPCATSTSRFRFVAATNLTSRSRGLVPPTRTMVRVSSTRSSFDWMASLSISSRGVDLLVGPLAGRKNHLRCHLPLALRPHPSRWRCWSQSWRSACT